MKIARFDGFIRTDGHVGVRNNVALIPSVICANGVVEQIKQRVPECKAFFHKEGCDQLKDDARLTMRTLIGAGSNPNIAAALVIGLGCEEIRSDELAEEIAASGRPVKSLDIQDYGTSKAISIGTRLARKLVKAASHIRRKPADPSSIVLGVECGASDWTSGLASNPVLGIASDILVDNGGTVVMSETTEFIGAEHIFARRAANAAARRDFLQLISRAEKELKRSGFDIRGTQPTPGNIQGGITTLEEKSLGAYLKGGRRKFEGVLTYSEKPRTNGLFVMDSPGFDVESITGMVAGGAQLVAFTTGRGSPVGSAVSPVIKITANKQTYRRMRENIDFYAGDVINGDRSIETTGEELFQQILQVASGKITTAEKFGFSEFSIYRLRSSI